MGQYQPRPATTETPSSTKSSGDLLPVFGSPADSESYLATLTPGSVIHGNALDKSPSTPVKPQDDDQGDTEEALVASGEELMKQQQLVNEGACQRRVPIVFHWDHGGHDVYISGSFNNWTKIQMSKSREDFTAILDLPEGRHEYKFYVDGQWLHDSKEEVQDNGLGTLNNVVNVTEKDFDAFNEQIDFSSLKFGTGSPPGSYNQIIPARSATTSLPPHLPPLLQQTILNQDPPSEEHATLLPEPNHVVLNHLYALSIKDGVLVMASTSRYKEKYVTTLMYKPV